MNIYDITDTYYDTEAMDQSMWEALTMQEQIEYLDRAWEDKMDQYAPRDCDEGDWGTIGELDEADYYSVSPNGDTIPW